MSKLCLLFVAFAALCLTGTLSAGTLATAPAQGVFGTSAALYCDILYLGNGTSSVTVEVKDYSGIVSTTETFSLASGQAHSTVDIATGAYCEFTVSGKSKTYRAAAIYYGTAGNYLMSIDAK